MKNISNYILLAGLLLIGGCKKFDGSMNVDPNNPSRASGTQLIANAQLALPDMSSSPYGVHYPQFLSNTSFPDNSRYVTTNFNFYGWYTGPLMNLETVLNSTLDANEGPVVNQKAVAKILKAYFYWFMTDRWGDIPFSEALKAGGNFTPKYDKQRDIYIGLFKLLDEANAEIVAGNIKNDIIYGGDINKWKRFGNTIHMLMGLRLSKVEPALGSVEFNKGLNNGIMGANSDNFTYPHPPANDPSTENYWYNSFTRLGRNWFAVSKPIVDYMKPLNDPRLPIFANKAVSSNDYVGLPYGLPGSTTVVINNFSLLGSSIRLQNSPVYLVTYAQALFARAEAAKLGWIAGGDAVAKPNYDLAIEMSIRQWNNNDVSGLAAYMANPEVQYTPADAIRKIATQRWVHLFLNGYEAWAEWRRTGFPVLVAAPGANGDMIPRREGYPLQEKANNTANYDAAIANFPYGGADDLNARVWWDKP